MTAAVQVEAIARELGLKIDRVNYRDGEYSLTFWPKYRHRLTSNYALQYDSINGRFTTSNGIRLTSDQAAAYVAACPTHEDPNPWLVMEQCGIDPWNNWRHFQ